MNSNLPESTGPWYKVKHQTEPCSIMTPMALTLVSQTNEKSRYHQSSYLTKSNVILINRNVLAHKYMHILTFGRSIFAGRAVLEDEASVGGISSKSRDMCPIPPSVLSNAVLRGGRLQRMLYT